MVAGVHARVIQVVEDRHLVQGLHVLEVAGRLQVTSFLGEEVGFVETEAAADEKNPLGRGCRLGLGGGTQVKRLQGEGEGGPGLEKVFSAYGVHSDWLSIE